MRPRIRRATAVLVLVLPLLACGDDAARVAEHLAAGDAYLEEEAYAEAVIEYKNILQIDPNDAGAHWGLARAFLATGKVQPGYWELRETVRLDPSNAEARLQYGQLSRLAGEHEDALAQADAVLAADEENVAAWLLRAQALDGLRRYDEAREAYISATEKFPEEPAPLLLTANFFIGQGMRNEAEPYYRRLTEVQPGFSAYAALGGYLAQQERYDEAEQAYLEARTLAEEDRAVLAHRVLASFYYSRERFEEAEQVLRAAQDEYPDDLDLIYVLARFYASRGDEERADAMIEEATRAQPEDVRPFLVLSAYRGRKGDLEGALAAADSALEVDPEDVRARLRRAELLLDLGYRNDDAQQRARGRAVVEAVLSQNPSSPEGLFVKAKLELAENDRDQAVSDLRRAIDLKPDWAEAHYLLGSALFLERDLNGARVEVIRALEIDGQLVEARKVLARIYALSGENDLAIEEGRRILRQRPGDTSTRLLVAQSLVRDQRFSEGLELLGGIPDDEQTGETLYATGRIWRIRGDDAKARVYFERANETLPNQPQILESLLQLDRREGRIGESVARVEAATKAEPENAKLMHLLGMLQVLSGKGLEAEASFRKAIQLDPNDLAPYQSLAQYLALTGRREEVLSTYERAAAQRPDSAGLQLVLGSLYEAYGDLDQAEKAYERAIEVDPRLAPAKNNLAYILAESGRNLDRALDLAQEAKSMLPESGHTADTLGWVLYKKGIPSAAVGYLLEAEGLFEADDPNLGIVRHHLAQAYEAAEQKEEAREALRRALRDLERIQASFRETTGKEPEEPPWLAEIRAMLERLEQET